MNSIVKEFVDYVVSNDCPQHDKAKVKRAIQDKFLLTLDRSVFYCDYFAGFAEVMLNGKYMYIDTNGKLTYHKHHR